MTRRQYALDPLRRPTSPRRAERLWMVLGLRTVEVLGPPWRLIAMDPDIVLFDEWRSERVDLKPRHVLRLCLLGGSKADRLTAKHLARLAGAAERALQAKKAAGEVLEQHSAELHAALDVPVPSPEAVAELWTEMDRLGKRVEKARLRAEAAYAQVLEDEGLALDGLYRDHAKRLLSHERRRVARESKIGGSS